MKKKIIGAILALGAGLALFAAGSRDTVVTIEGKLAVVKGVPTVVSGDKSWVLPAAPFYQIAWENGIKAGDSIKAEGYVMDGRGGPGGAPGVAPSGDQNNVAGTMFMPTKVWVNGKEIDISTVSRMMGPPMDRQRGAPGMDAGRSGARDDQRPANPGNSGKQ